MVREERSEKVAGQRPLRVGEALRHALAEVLERGDLRDPDLQGVPVTVTEVRVTPDLRSAVIFILPLGGGKVAPALAALTRATPYLRGVLARMLRLKFAPSLRFRADQSFDEASRIAALLRDPRVAADLGADAEDSRDSKDKSKASKTSGGSDENGR